MRVLTTSSNRKETTCEIDAYFVMCITKQKEILLTQGKDQFTDEARSPTLKIPNWLFSKPLVQLEAEKKKQADFIWNDKILLTVLQGWQVVRVLFIQALYWSPSVIHNNFYSTSSEEQVLACLAHNKTLALMRASEKPQSVNIKYITCYVPLENLRHSKSYWRSHCKAANE